MDASLESGVRVGTRWRTLLGDYPTTHALRHGALTSPRLTLAFEDVTVPNKAFKRVVRDVEFDVAEIAVMTYLMARSRGVPLRVLPVTVFSRSPLPFLVCHSERPIAPHDLAHCRIGVRAYTTTTAIWLRALVADLFGVSFLGSTWMTTEEGHVADAPDPPSVTRNPSFNLVEMLRTGALDALIIDPVPNEPWCIPVLPDALGAFQRWCAAHEAHTLNHVVAVRESLTDDAAAMRALFRLFADSRELGGPAAATMAPPPGFTANRRNFEVAIAAATSQALLARPLTLEDLFTDVLASLE